uniref:DUF676 domain-containing protein n=1 Tax=Aegilops tauschii subsp. strangulata TaxID=200361 RepID=A0A453QQF1_AEGTS
SGSRLGCAGSFRSRSAKIRQFFKCPSDRCSDGIRFGSLFPTRLNTTKYLCSHPMSTGRGSPVSCSSMEASKSKPGPEHLIVLVHGIMASPSDWTYGEAVLKKRLGDNFFIYGMRAF